MTKVCIMQPTFLPYYGYFKLIQEADIFVFLDNVQFSRQSWQQRNKFNVLMNDCWLTVPVAQRLGQKLNEVKVMDDIKEYNKLIKTLKQNFGYELIENKPLSELNIANIKFICQELGIKTKFVRASGIKMTNIVSICKELKATEYISTGGSRVYFDDDLEGRFLSNNIILTFKDYDQDYSIVQYLKDKKYLKEKGLL